MYLLNRRKKSIRIVSVSSKPKEAFHTLLLAKKTTSKTIKRVKGRSLKGFIGRFELKLSDAYLFLIV